MKAIWKVIVLALVLTTMTCCGLQCGSTEPQHAGPARFESASAGPEETEDLVEPPAERLEDPLLDELE
jgi:hypothetical protein